MPWRVKRELYMILIGAAAVGLGVTVAIRNSSLDTRLLAIGLILGGLAILINVLPNGHDDP